MRLPVLMLIAGALSGCAVIPDCVPAQGWRAGYAGEPAGTHCPSREDRTWLEAYRLGSRYAEFERRLAAIQAALAGDPAPNSLPRLRMDQRRVVREMEQIEGVARIRGWPLPETSRSVPGLH